MDKPLVRAALAVSGRRAGGKIHVAPAIPGSLQSGRGKPELISQPIVFVVGAGASAEFNLPAGGE